MKANKINVSGKVSRIDGHATKILEIQVAVSSEQLEEGHMVLRASTATMETLKRLELAYIGAHFTATLERDGVSTKLKQIRNDTKKNEQEQEKTRRVVQAFLDANA